MIADDQPKLQRSIISPTVINFLQYMAKLLNQAFHVIAVF